MCCNLCRIHCKELCFCILLSVYLVGDPIHRKNLGFYSKVAQLIVNTCFVKGVHKCRIHCKNWGFWTKSRVGRLRLGSSRLGLALFGSNRLGWARPGLARPSSARLGVVGWSAVCGHFRSMGCGSAGVGQGSKKGKKNPPPRGPPGARGIQPYIYIYIYTQVI